MKNFWLGICLLLSTTAMAQTHMRVWQKGDGNRMKLKEMTFSNSGKSVAIGDTTYTTTDIDSIVMVQEVDVVFNGETATVSVPKVVENDIVVTMNGAHVNITNNNLSNEIEFVVSGATTNGSLNYRGDYKCTFTFDNLSITNPDSAAVSLKCGKRVALKLVGTNTLVDGATGNQKGCLYCKGHLEIEGEDGNTLSITANAKHGICTKEYLQLKRSTGIINIISAASDAIHCGQYFQMNGGAINIDANTTGDGIQVDTCYLDDGKTIDPEKEYNSQIFIKGGSITETIAHEDCKGIKCGSDITISGGTINITAQGNGSRGIQTDGNMVIGDEDATTTITINATGGKCSESSDKHKCMGIKVDGTLTVNGGTTTVTATGSSGKSIKVTGNYYPNGGVVTDDPKMETGN